MEIREKISIGKYGVNIALSSLKGSDGKYAVQFGKGAADIQTYGQILIHPDKIEIKSDCFSGQRIYHWLDGDSIYITDDVRNFIEEDELLSLEIDEFEKNYFLKHGYTSGDSTIYKKIKKLPPASILTVNKDGLAIESYWPLISVPNTPDRARFEKGILDSVTSHLSPLRNMDRPVVLCFSGGKDSTYLAAILKKLGIKHDLVFFRDTTNKFNNAEIRRAKEKAGQLGKELTVLDITTGNDPAIENEINAFNRFDRHYCRYHYYGLKAIKDKYGENAILVNGQNADSILSYGPSENKFSSKIKRYLLYGSSMMLKKMEAFIIGGLFRKKLLVPKTEEEKLIAFYDNFKYCLLIDSMAAKNRNKISQKIYRLKKFITGRIESGDMDFNNLMMAIKSFTHIQGPDAQVVLQSAKYFGLDIIMPLSNFDIMKTTLQFKDDRVELNHPKYALDWICERL